MGNKQIIFTAPNTAELVDVPTGEPGEFDVLVDVAYSTISPGTERSMAALSPSAFSRRA